MSSVNLSQDHSASFTTIPTNSINWKSLMRKKQWTKRPIRKSVPRLPESIKSKNIPKNIAKAVIQQILHHQVDDQIENKTEFFKYINKHKNIQNLATLLKSTRPHRVERINKLQQQFRQICWNFFRKQYIAYVFTSKVKDPQNHLQYRSQLMKIFSEHFQ